MAEVEIRNHRAHLQGLLKKASPASPDSIKDLVDYLITKQSSEHAEVILTKGVELLQKNPDYFSDENMYMIEEFFYAACELA
jgi:hypothetical protein